MRSLLACLLLFVIVVSCGKDDNENPTVVVPSPNDNGGWSSASQQRYYPQGSCVYIRSGNWAGYTGFTERYDNVANVYLVRLYQNWSVEVLAPAYRLSPCN
jgi:hypothetical protein